MLFCKCQVWPCYSQCEIIDSYLCHLDKVQWRSLFLYLFRSSSLNSNFLVIKDTWLRPTSRKPIGAPCQLWCRGRCAACWGQTIFRKGNLIMGTRERSLDVNPATLRRAMIITPNITCLSVSGWLSHSLAWLTAKSIAKSHLVIWWGKSTWPGRKAKAWTSLHGCESIGVTLHASPAVAASLFYRSPDLWSYGPPWSPATRHLIGKREWSALAFAGRCWRVAIAVTKAEILDQVGYWACVSWLSLP